MKIARLACLVASLMLLTLLAACGNKGDLVRPVETAPPDAPAAN